MNHHSKIILATAMAALLAAAANGADPAPSTAPSGNQPATMTAAEEAHWRNVLTQLSSTSFSDRENAQKELDKLTYKQTSLLKQLAAGATDAEVKSRLLNRVIQIEEELAYSPPPISLEIKNGYMSDVAAALGKAMDIDLETWPPRDFSRQNGPAWELSAKEKPFWDVIFELQQQRSFGVQDYDGELRLTQQEPGLRAGKIFGALAVFPQAITRLRTSNLQADPGSEMQPEVMRLEFTAILDPRVKVTHYMQPEFTKVVDDLGNILFQQANQGPAQWTNAGRIATHIWTQGIPLTIPQKPGKKIASAQGQVRLLVQLAADTVEVKDIDKKLNTPFKIGDKTVTFQQFKPNPDNQSVEFQVAVSSPERTDFRRVGQDEPRTQVTVSYIDSTGKHIWGQTLDGGSGGSFGGQFTPPLKVVLSVPTKLKEVTLPFELKDLPLP